MHKIRLERPYPPPEMNKTLEFLPGVTRPTNNIPIDNGNSCRLNCIPLARHSGYQADFIACAKGSLGKMQTMGDKIPIFRNNKKQAFQK
jgi:hypothetical protein